VHDPAKAEFFGKFLSDKGQEDRLSVFGGFDWTNEKVLREAVAGVRGIFVNFPDWGVEKGNATRLLMKVIDEVYKDSATKPMVVRIVIYQDPKWGLPKEVTNLIAFTDIPEAELKELHGTTGVPYMLLQPGWFHQNFITFFGEFIKKSDIIPTPTSNSVLPYIDTRDIGHVAARILLNEFPYEPNSTYWLASAHHSYSQIAEMITSAVGRDIKYVDTDELIEEVFGSLGLMADMLSFYRFEGLISGKLPLTDPILLEHWLGRKPHSFTSFAHENKAAFSP